MFEYLGVLETTETVVSAEDNIAREQRLQLLVMQNLRLDSKKFRMLDLKIGQVTAQAGWKGKSRIKALKAGLSDAFTNSAAEGYRLTGFNGGNEVFDSLDPLIDLLSGEDQPTEDGAKLTVLGGEISEKQVKRAKRLMINLLDGTEALNFFLDVHMDQYGETSETEKTTNVRERYLPIEMAEIVSHEIVSRLLQLFMACNEVKVPQKWIGSSVALGYDAGLLPRRDASAEEAIRSKVLVNLFDWGRSELLTRKQYESLTPAEKSDRKLFWDYYKAGIARLSFNATRSYFHQFTNVGRWTKIVLQVMDFDSM